MNIFSETIRRIFYWPPAYPQTIQIGITNICNFNCAMCQRFDLQVALQHLPLTDFRIIVDKINNKLTSDLILTGWGEPLTHPDFLAMVAYASDKGFKVRFTTNGSLLTPDKINHFLAHNLQAITFSIDQLDNTNNTLGHQIGMQLENIKNFIALKKEMNKQTQVYLQTTYPQKGEDNILKIIDFAEQIGADRVKISRLDIRFQPLARPTLADELSFVNKIEEYTHGKAVQVDFSPHLAFNGLMRRLYRIIYPYLHRHGRFCLRTFSDLYINEKGLATPCCALPNYVIGNALTEEIKTIWQSKKMKDFRRQQKNICGRCDVLAVDYKN